MSTPPPAPSRNDRKACWAARDEFFQCLNANSVNVPPEFQPRGQGACAKQREAYEGACAKSWVGHGVPNRRIDAIGVELSDAWAIAGRILQQTTRIRDQAADHAGRSTGGSGC
jgi:hypothetical protein